MRHIRIRIGRTSSAHERRDAFAAFRVDIRTCPDQQVHLLRITTASGMHERRGTSAVFRVDIRTRFDQQLRHIPTREHKRCAACTVFRVDVRTCPNQ